MSSLPLSPEQRAQKWGTIAKWGIFAGFGFFFAPIAMATITGMLALIVVGVIGLVTWALLPAAQDAAKNLRLKLIKAEAAKHPIETLESEYLRRSTLLDERKTTIETFEAKTRTFGDKLDGFKHQYPAEAPKFQTQFDQMQLLLKRQRDQWKEARRNLTVFDGVIQKAKAMWDMALAAAAARAGSELDEAGFNAKLKTECALDSIQDGMNSAFSQLDTLIMEGDAQEDTTIETSQPAAALPAPSGSVIDVPVTKVRSVAR